MPWRQRLTAPSHTSPLLAPMFCCSLGLSEARVDRIPHNTFAGSEASSSAAARSGSGGGERSTHFTVCCAGCGAAVGRLYTEVPTALALIQNLFCLEADRCTSYELGTAELRASGSTAAQQQQQRQPAAAGAAGAAAAAGGAGVPGVDASLVLNLLQRIEHLEASLCTVSRCRPDPEAAVSTCGCDPLSPLSHLPHPLQLQGMQVLHDTQLRELPGYQGDAAACNPAPDIRRQGLQAAGCEQPGWSAPRCDRREMQL